MPATLGAKSKNSFEITWNKDKPFFGEKLFRSIEYLGFRKRNLSAVAACETIEKIVAEQSKYRLFQNFFPNEWKNSRTSFFKTGYYENYSERINEFFQLVHEKLFPVLSGWNDDPEAELENFFIFSFNIDLCCEEIEYDSLRISYVFALIFFFQDDEQIWEFLAANYKLCREDFPDINERPHENLWRRQGHEKAALYVNLFEVIDHSTGNPWLDTMNCRGGECLSWDEDTIIYLTESYQESQRLLEQTVILDGMIEASPKNVLLDLIALWNDGELPKQEKKQRIKREKLEAD